jgi:hypothetical protein
MKKLIRAADTWVCLGEGDSPMRATLGGSGDAREPRSLRADLPEPGLPEN